MNKKLKKFVQIYFLFFTFIFLIIGLVIFFFVRNVTVEDYCWNKALKDTGNNADNLVSATAEETKESGGITKITLWYRQELQCDKETKFFFLF